MALDGIVIHHIVHELKNVLLGGRIDKIYQIEKEDILLSIRNNGTSYKLLLTANSNYPRLHLSTLTKSPSTEPPMFCMMLRKHLGGGKIINLVQPDFERIVEIHIEATNELGDKETKKLIIEIMGRHSNIILTKEDHTILDSIKHISLDKSSVREVLPNRIYTRPPNQNKLNPLMLTEDTFTSVMHMKDLPLYKALYTSFSGLSPIFAHELCLSAHLDGDASSTQLPLSSLSQLYYTVESYMNKIKEGCFTPTLYLDASGLPTDFYSLKLELYKEYTVQDFTSISELLEYYFFERSTRFNVSQKTSDIKKLLHTFIDRAVRKKQIQESALEESAHKDLYKVYGELLTAYSHQIQPGISEFTTLNYYEEPYEEITIPLDSHKTGIQNAQAYFKLYNKAKRTEIAATEQLLMIEEDLNYLHSVLLSLDLLETKEDIEQLRSELIEMGYLKKRKGSPKKKMNKKELPYLRFKSSLGHDIYVGKNNYQNDELTMKFAKSNDLWLHIKEGPGSHVIVRNVDGQSFDDSTLLEAATLAAYYSSGKLSSNVPIDYTLKKNVKKIPGAKPGMVIYTQFKTIYVTPNESFVKKLTL